MLPHSWLKIGRCAVLLVLLVSVLFAGQPLRVAQAVWPIYFVKPNGGGNCWSWGAACSLQAALSTATVGEIRVMKGTYTPGTARTDTFQLKNHVYVYGGFVGTETDLSQRNAALNETILSGEIGVPTNTADNSFHVVTGSGLDDAVLDGFTITAGNSTGAANLDGAGMLISGGHPTLFNLKWIGNHAAGNGGGLSILNAGSALLFPVFIANSAGGSGGGMYAANSLGLTLVRAMFSANSAVNGGGIYCENGSTLLSETIFQQNSASFNGGGVYLDGDAGTIGGVTFDRNTAANAAGGMDLINGSGTVTASTFSGNSANYAAGLGVQAGSPHLVHLTLSGNHANISGGGLTIFDSSSDMRGSIVWGNTAPAAPEIDLPSNPAKSQFANSVMADGCPSGATCAPTILLTDPMLGALGSYGGQTPTIPLLFGSSAIDVADAADCSSSDQRGVARPQGAGCDLGAYEARAFKLSMSGMGQSAGIGLPFKAPLEISFSSDFGDPVDGAKLVFTTPSSGASATPETQSATVSGGTASAHFTANGVVGFYFITMQVGVLSLPIPYYNGPLATISSSQSRSFVGQPVTLSVQVSVPDGTPGGTPTGTVSLSEVGTPNPQSITDTLIGPQALVDGKAAFSLTNLSIGAHTFTVSYSGDANYPPTESGAFVQNVTIPLFLPLARR